jgi:hypothetical protein
MLTAPARPCALSGTHARVRPQNARRLRCCASLEAQAAAGAAARTCAVRLTAAALAATMALPQAGFAKARV